MKVTQVALRPTEASAASGRPSLTPELLAASGARYSRSNEGLDGILQRIDPENLDKSVDSIFRMIDYGHQSIADMAPAAMFIDGISIWLAYYVWSICPTAGGQESSTRYIRLSIDELASSSILGMDQDSEVWKQSMQDAFNAYSKALNYWESLADLHPTIARIPKSLLSDPSEKAQKQVARMRRNFGFDRARYFLPVSCMTNVMLIMSARAWVQLCQHLLSHPLPEARHLGRAIVQELELVTPRMTRHASAKESYVQGIKHEFNDLSDKAKATSAQHLEANILPSDHPAEPILEIYAPDDVTQENLSESLAFHDNRYSFVGSSLRRTTVRFSWEAVALAEIRDLNRHRTGTKFCPLIPLGFYCAQDQIDSIRPSAQEPISQLQNVGRSISNQALSRLRAGDPSYIYWTLLGTQYKFEHTTTADKFIYEAELRTGTGAHYRYAQHLRDTLSLWYQRFPDTESLVLEGSAEPE